MGVGVAPSIPSEWPGLKNTPTPKTSSTANPMTTICVFFNVEFLKQLSNQLWLFSRSRESLLSFFMMFEFISTKRLKGN